MNSQNRFEAVFDDGDEDRYPEWVVIEWTYINYEGTRRAGNIVEKHGMNKDAAISAACSYNLIHAFDFG